jgi:predicted nucleic acid-binding protein
MAIVRDEVFLDSSYAIALAATSDQHHDEAVELAAELEEAGTRLITTRAVLLEIGNALAKRRYRDGATQLLTSVESDQNIEIMSFTDELYGKALVLFQHRSDKEWSLTDCASFVVMQERALTEALTADDHFRQAGFQILLRR